MMTHEQRLDRLERIAKLFVKAGLRARNNIRAMDEKINILISAHIANEASSAELDEKFKILVNNQIRHDEKFKHSDKQLAKLAERTTRYDRLFPRHEARFEKFNKQFKRLDAQSNETREILMEILRELRSGRRWTGYLNIEPKIHYIAFLHDVVFPFQSR